MANNQQVKIKTVKWLLIHPKIVSRGFSSYNRSFSNEYPDKLVKRIYRNTRIMHNLKCFIQDHITEPPLFVPWECLDGVNVPAPTGDLSMHLCFYKRCIHNFNSDISGGSHAYLSLSVLNIHVRFCLPTKQHIGLFLEQKPDLRK